MSKPIVRLASLVLLSCAASVRGQTCGPWSWVNPLPQGNTLEAVASGGGRYVAVGRAGTILISADGATWQLRPSGTTADLLDVLWDGSGFLAVGAEGADVSGATA